MLLILAFPFALMTILLQLNAQTLPGDLVSQQQTQAQAGDPKAQYELAVRYLDGNRVPQDKGKAVFWLKKSAEQGYPEAEFRYSEFAPKEERILWLRRAAEAGDASAPSYLAEALTETGDDINNLLEAVRWYDAEDPSRARPIRNYLQDLSRQGLLDKVKAGDPSAQMVAASLLLERGAAIQNYEKIARGLISRAAAQQNPKAEFQLGEMLVRQGNKTEAESMFLKASQHGQLSAYVQLGKLALQRGDEINGGSDGQQIYYNKANYKQAVEYFQTAASAGVPSAFFEMGRLYEEGIPTPRVLTPQTRPVFKSEFVEAIKNYERAAQLHDATAQARLCLIYSGNGKRGQEVKNLIRAAMWALVLQSSDNPTERGWGRQWLRELSNPTKQTEAGITSHELQAAQQAASAFLAGTDASGNGAGNQ